ncbi:MAG: ADP-ribosylglycohydrolase family protein [Propionibacteriaceae bacterium]|nr:ADP-ribosylglycohydrolase family protein [Propionibacteriaceae bacterium]
MNEIEAGFLGLAVGDALGVPVEFSSRAQLDAHPVDGMFGNGTYRKPAGTWSDDTSLSLALADSLAHGEVDYADIMAKFISWYQDSAYTTDGQRFDIGTTTFAAFQRFLQGAEPTQSGGPADSDNGNGSLMRILPITFYLRARNGKILTDEGVDIIHNLSALTHRHPRSQVACVTYCNIAHHVLEDSTLLEAVQNGIAEVEEYYADKPTFFKELSKFKYFRKDELNNPAFPSLERDDVRSSGYVVDTLDAALWCLLHHEGYHDTVLAAVNLGGDTDTKGAICGALAGLYYQTRKVDESTMIPQLWLDEIVNKEAIMDICERFSASLPNG